MLLSDLPFRLGTTSYIIPDDILPNVRFLADKVQDIQLVLFELDDAQSNLPDARQVTELNALAAEFGLTYTVHLPLDLRLASYVNDVHLSLQKAQRVIEATQILHPQAYIVHLDGQEEWSTGSEDRLAPWRRQAVQSLQYIAHFTGDIRLLAVENLANYPVDFNDQVIRQSGCMRCIDIGHLWLDGHDPIVFFAGRFNQTSVMHLHGIHERDHQSLQYVPDEKMDALFGYLLQNNFTGVLTLEVFSEEDLSTSKQAIAACLNRISD